MCEGKFSFGVERGLWISHGAVRPKKISLCYWEFRLIRIQSWNPLPISDLGTSSDDDLALKNTANKELE